MNREVEVETILFSNYKNKLLVTSFKKGQKEAFVTLINDNKLNMYRVGKAMLDQKEDIEDAIQNTIVKAYENIHTLRKEEFFKTWLIRILINECNEILRKKKKIISLEEGIPNNHYMDKYSNLDLNDAVSKLSEELRITTVLFYFEDMSLKEIAKVLEIPEGTVRSRLTRARKQLKVLMERE